MSLIKVPEEDTLALSARSLSVSHLEERTGVFRAALDGIFGWIEGIAQGIMGQ